MHKNPVHWKQFQIIMSKRCDNVEIQLTANFHMTNASFQFQHIQVQAMARQLSCFAEPQHPIAAAAEVTAVAGIGGSQG